jgi:hypothetical protein
LRSGLTLLSLRISSSTTTLADQGMISFVMQKLILQRHSAVSADDVHDRLEVDVLITGCEASLWIGEQFASDLQDLFPALRVVAMSANKIIGTISLLTVGGSFNARSLNFWYKLLRCPVEFSRKCANVGLCLQLPHHVSQEITRHRA